MDKQLLSETVKDLEDNFEELLYLFSSSKKQLEQFLKDSERQKNHILSFEDVKKITQQYIAIYEKNIKTVRRYQHLEKPSEKSIEKLTKEYACYYDLYRTYQSLIAGLITASDWQSPSFHHTVYAMAGRQTGKIIANYNDYKRDHHLDAQDYVQKFRNEYLSGLLRFTIPTFLTNSGMAALTTILNFLEMEQKITGPILLGSSSYFQNKELIKRLFTGVIEVHEHDTDTIVEIIEKKHPSVLFFDSLCNSYDIAVPNLPQIIDTLKKTVTKDTYIIIDNTCLASSFQPLQLLGNFPKHIHMIVFESMNKYYQFGMDKTMGGIIYGYGKDIDKIFFTRQHSGTIISDTSCYLLPPPNNKILTKRLARHERNVSILTNALTEYIRKTPKHPVKEIIYPSVSSHPAHEWSKNLSFHGSYFTFSWHTEYDKASLYQKFVKAVLTEAKNRKVHLTEGTSFGLPTSRIYVTAKNTKFGKPFVRFAVGTETRQQIEDIKQVLVKAMQNL